MTFRKTSLALLLVSATLCSQAQAQWLNYPAPGTPRTPDGKPNLSARAPRASDGKPDFSGIWRVEATPLDELTRLFGDVTTLSVPGDDTRTFSKYLFNILADFKPEEEPMRPETAEIFRQRAPSAGKDFPTSQCLPAGVPTALVIPIPFKIIQTPGLIAMLFEGDNTIRQIYTDGRKHSVPDIIDPTYSGESIGHWEDATLVIDTVAIREDLMFDYSFAPHSDALHITERVTRNGDVLEDEMTLDDPRASP